MHHVPVPGDDILDAIEEGSADNAVMSKFKINGDQLRAFKSLHYGLSNEEMKYDEINDYYPELESYFKLAAPLARPQGEALLPLPGSNSVPGVQEPEPDIFKLVQDKVRLGKELSASQDISRNAKLYMGAAPLANDEATLNKRKTELSAIDDQLRKAGYDPGELTKTLGDMPNIPGFNYKAFLQLQKDNPLTAERKKAAIKSQYSLLHAIENKEGAKAANTFLHQYQLLQSSPDYASQRQATKAAIAAVHKYVDSTDEQNRIIKDMIRDKSYGYGVGLPGQEESIANDPRAERLNPYQVIGMQFMDDVDPAKAQAYNRLLAFSPEDIEQMNKNSSFMRGFETKNRDLENIGMNLMKNSLEEKMTSMLKNKDQWSEKENQEYTTIYERYKTLTEDFNKQNNRYSSLAVMDADRLMQDAMGESSKGVAEKTILGIGENADDAINWIGNLIQEPFRTSKESALDDLQRLGDKKLSQLGQYETDGQELFNRDFKTVFTGALKTKIDNIKSDTSLSEDEKRDSITKEILADNNKSVKYVPNDQGGKMNFTAKAVTHSVSKVISEIAPQIALAYMSGGAANASKAQELTSLFTSTFATAYNDIYNDAIEKDIPNPSQYALVHTTIEAGTELLFNDMGKLKKLFGNKLTGKILEGVTEESMQALSKTGRFSRLIPAIKEMGKTGLKEAGQEGLEEGVGTAAGNIADKKLFNQDVNVTDDVLKDFTTTAIGMLPLAGLGLPFRYKEISQMQKNALYEAAMNPDKFLAKVDEDLKNNRITSSEAEARKETISKAAKLVRAMNAVRSDGSVLTDNEKTELLTNEVVADTVNEKKKNAPEETKEKLIKVEETLDKEKEKLLKPEKNATKRKTKAETKAQDTGNVTDVPATNEPSPPGADNNMGVRGESAPAGDLHYTTPEGTKYVLRGDDLYHVDKDGNETRFAKKSLQTPEAQEFIAKIKEQSDKPSQAVTTEQIPGANLGLQKAETVPETKPTPTGDLHYTAPEGTKYVLRGKDLYRISENGKETKFAEKAMQMPATQELISKIKEANNADTLSQKQNLREAQSVNEITINTEEDFEREINRVMQNKAPRFDEVAPNEINNNASENSFDDYYKKAQAVLHNLLPGLNIKVYNDENEYYVKEQRPKNSLGNYDPTAHSIAFNLPLINRVGRQRNVFHEIIHPIVDMALGKNQEHLLEIYDSIEQLKDIPGLKDVWEHMNQYFHRGGKIQKIEAVTQFLTLVADGKIDTSSLSEKAITKIIDLINKIFEALGIEKRISTASDIKRFSDSIVKAFQEQNTDSLKATLGDRFTGNNGTEVLDQLSNQDQEDAIKALIKKTPASIPDARLNELIVKATGLTVDEAQALIDEVRKPVVPIDQGKPLHHLSQDFIKSSLKKVDRALEVPKRNEPTWLQRQREAIKNGSAYIDNPFRFITKTAEDINKTYGLSNNEQIPLGRQLEKSATGRAVLKVDAFINEVIRGNIDGRKLGRLKGEKYKDFQRYLFAKRVEDRLYKQEEKQLAGEDVSRQTGNVTRIDAEATIQYLKNKYGDLDDFVARSNALQRHMDDMLFSLVGAGILSKETYDQIKADNDFYAPFSVVQSKLYADQDKQPVGINGVLKRIKGISFKPLEAQQDKRNPFSLIDSLSVIDALGDALHEKVITPEEYFTTALQILADARDDGKISIAEYNRRVAELENPGFAINDILDAAANMIYKAEGMTLRNTMLQRLYAYKKYDTEGLFIQDVDGHQAMTLPDGSTRMVPKPLSSIKVEPGMAPIKLRVDGKDIIVAVDKRAASKITTMSNFEVSSALRVLNAVNKIFRAIVITASPGFQVANFVIDFARTSMFSRYGPIAGKGYVQPMVNFMLYLPQYMEALVHSALGSTVHKTKTYKQWMQSDSFSTGMFGNPFDSERRIKEVNAPTAKRVLMNFLKLHFIDVPGSILEQTHKLAVHQRGMSIEGFKPEMFTALLASTMNRNIKPNMTVEELKDGMDRLNYEVQNFAGSPNFGQTHRWMKLTSIFLQFFSARVKGEMTDYRRILNVFRGKGEGVKLTRQEALQIGVGQMGSALLMVMAYAFRNNGDDEDEKEFNGVSPNRRDNSLNIPLGYFEYEDEDGNKSKLRDYAQIPLRGVTATMNVMANSYVKFYKRHNPEEFKKAALAFAANASPINLNGSDEREYGESIFSNLTPISKYFVEFSFNRDTYHHRNIIPDFVQGKGMLSRFRAGEINPWDVATKKTPQWAKTMSKFIFDNLGIRVSAIELDHMENNMGNPTELYNNAIKKRLFRSDSQYPLYQSPTENKNTSSAIFTPDVK